MRTPVRAAATVAVVALTLTAPSPVVAQSGGRAELVVTQGSTASVEGTSNLHDWTCESSRLDASILIRIDGRGQPVALDRVWLSLPVKSLGCGRGGMDKNLYEALDASQSPMIRYRMTTAEVTPDPKGTVRVVARGQLTVAGVTKPVTLEAIGRPAGEGFLITGSHPLKMTDFGIAPPKALLGTLRTGDDVVVRFQLRAVPRPL